ncbi:hypothetical protein AMECASPLE_034735 [Ameca splendens]|uniref:Uncharacterized protein n=1 Tax=Ameca splendens TaxID=208324 RepID=A0ABV0XWG5_9TELE
MQTDQYSADLTSFCFTGFPNNEKRKLVHLSGTLPVLYQGQNYLHLGSVKSLLIQRSLVQTSLMVRASQDHSPLLSLVLVSPQVVSITSRYVSGSMKPTRRPVPAVLFVRLSPW